MDENWSHQENWKSFISDWPTWCFFLPFFSSKVIVQTAIWQKALPFLRKKFTWLSKAVGEASSPVGADTHWDSTYLKMKFGRNCTLWGDLKKSEKVQTVFLPDFGCHQLHFPNFNICSTRKVVINGNQRPLWDGSQNDNLAWRHTSGTSCSNCRHEGKLVREKKWKAPKKRHVSAW